MENETAAVKIDTNKQIFSDEMLAKIAEAERQIEINPNDGQDAFEFINAMRKEYGL